MTSRTTILPVLLSLLALAGCGSQPAANDQPGNVIMPLRVGNAWIMGTTTNGRDQRGHLITLYDTLAITGTEQIGDEVWYRANTGELYINRSTGLWMRKSSASAGEGHIARYPGTPGEAYGPYDQEVTLPGKPPQDLSLMLGMRVMGTDEEITVPAGTYRCYHYGVAAMVVQTGNGTTETLAHDMWYAPGVGPVRILPFDGGAPMELVKMVSR